MANIVYRQMLAPQELSQQIPAPKPGSKSPRVGETFWCKSPEVHEGMVMDGIDTCIIWEGFFGGGERGTTSYFYICKGIFDAFVHAY